MEWDKPFVVYRIDSEGKLSEVYRANALKDAKYWLSYIAEPGDVLCRTPAHPRHSSELPSYWSHKEQSGRAVSNEASWRASVEGSTGEVTFPSSPQLKDG